MSQPSTDSLSSDYDLVVAGGGAAGFFGALTFAESYPGSRVLILEKSSQVLGKVKISGGGRCNVTHACFDPKALTKFYPRGSKQLIGPFHHWSPTDTMDWFENRGVPLKIEEDGRVFPQSDSSQSIIDCLLGAAEKAGIIIRTHTALEAAEATADDLFDLRLNADEHICSKRLLLTLGGTRNRFGADLAASFGHRIEGAAPSLFTFKIADPRLSGLPGLSVAEATVQVSSTDPKLHLKATGPVLITHWGLSGPGILKVSAWGARELQKLDYRFDILVNWTGQETEAQILQRFEELRIESPRKSIINDPQFSIPSRLWKGLLESALTDSSSDQSELRWPHLPREKARRFAQELGACRFKVDGKSMNKDEFVTCGGVHLGDVQFKTMESRTTPGLHFAGEILDIDGVTGGFNFQAAWTTARLAGQAMAESLLGDKAHE
jgi:predicted Rossmann fold flavoprotein